MPKHTRELQENKDESGGYAGLTGFSLRLKNAAGTITSLLSSIATTARTWTFPDKDITVADDADVQAINNAKNAASGYPALDANHAIEIKNTAGTVTSKIESLATAARTYTLPDMDLVVGSGGGGGGGRNYVTNSSAEGGVSSGTGVSGGTVTVTEESGSPLAGDRSFLLSWSSHSIGDYAEFDLEDIDLIDRGGMAQLSFAKDDGTGFVAGDVEVVYYDGSTEWPVVIEDDSNAIASEGLIAYAGRITIPGSATTGGKIRFKALTTGHDFALIVDMMKFGPSSLPAVAAVTGAESYTPIFQGLGTPSAVNVSWWRSGKFMFLEGELVTGTVTAVEARVGLPNGYTIDSSVSANSWLCGMANRDVTSPARYVIATAGNNFLNFARGDAGNGLTPNNGNSAFGNSERISFFARVPIVGWSSHIAVAENAVGDLVSNSDSSSSDDSTSFASTMQLVPNLSSGTSSTPVSKRVRLSRPISAAKEIRIVVDPGGLGAELDASDVWPAFREVDDVGTGRSYGVRYSRVSGSDTDLDVEFGQAGAASSLAWAAEYAAGTTFGVRVRYSDGVVEAPTSAQIARIYDSKSSGTSGGTFTNGAWRTRDLNTLDNPLSLGWVSLSSNQFTLTPGKYAIHWSAPAYLVDQHQTRLQNITDGSTEQTGSTEFAGAANGSHTSSSGVALITIASAKTFEVQHRAGTTSATSGFGRNAGAIFTVAEEVYTQVWIRKIA